MINPYLNILFNHHQVQLLAISHAISDLGFDQTTINDHEASSLLRSMSEALRFGLSGTATNCAGCRTAAPPVVKRCGPPMRLVSTWMTLQTIWGSQLRAAPKLLGWDVLHHGSGSLATPMIWMTWKAHCRFTKKLLDLGDAEKFFDFLVSLALDFRRTSTHIYVDRAW